jgi:hypothetical protein
MFAPNVAFCLGGAITGAILVLAKLRNLKQVRVRPQWGYERCYAASHKQQALALEDASTT